MQSKPMPMKNNPLMNYMRQPKIYIRLPSDGKYWAHGSLEQTETGEYPVYSMTARDELLFKTPDALMNGQAVVDVIQSCMPNVKNAWACPTLDLDAILIALRLATYGEKMSFKHKVPVIDEELEYELDLRIILDKQQNNQWIETIAIGNELLVYVQPLTYKHLTKTNLKSFETSRIMSMVNDEKISDEKKLEMFNNSFANLTKITIDLMAESIFKIETPDAEVVEPKFIQEWVANADKVIFDKIQKHLAELKAANEIQPLEFTTTEEWQAQGAPATYTMPLNFNNSDFFG